MVGEQTKSMNDIGQKWIEGRTLLDELDADDTSTSWSVLSAKTLELNTLKATLGTTYTEFKTSIIAEFGCVK